LWDLAFLTDVTTHLNILNLKLQGPGKFIFDMYNSIKAFNAKLKLFINQIKRSDFSHFENCQIFKDNTKSLCSTNRFVCMLNKLQTDISSRFSDVKLHEYILFIFIFIIVFFIYKLIKIVFCNNFTFFGIFCFILIICNGPHGIPWRATCGPRAAGWA